MTFQQELVVKTVAAQLGTALDREYSYEEREEIRIAMERERLRSTLLRSVAHDLRSPLTALSGASSLLSDRYEQLSPEEQKKLAADISEEMIWLTNLVENILNMTRIGEGPSIWVNCWQESASLRESLSSNGCPWPDPFFAVII